MSKTLSLTGNLYETDSSTPDTRLLLSGPLSLNSLPLARKANTDVAIAPSTVDQAIELAAPVAEFFFARVTTREGGDCSFKIQPDAIDGVDQPEVVFQCNGGELWLNRTRIVSVKVSSVSGCAVWAVGGSRQLLGSSNDASVFQVTDGSAHVAGVSKISFTGATVTNPTPGEAHVDIVGGGGGGLTSPLSADLDVGTHKLTNSGAPTSPNDLTRKAYVDSGDTAAVASANAHADSGDTSTLSSAHSYTDSGDSTLASSIASNMATVFLKDGSRALTGPLDAGNHKLTNVTDPSSPQDAVTKAYGDSHYAGGGGSLEVTDGSDDETGVTKLTFSGAAVTPGAAGEAVVTISGGGGSGDFLADGSVPMTGDLEMRDGGSTKHNIVHANKVDAAIFRDAEAAAGNRNAFSGVLLGDNSSVADNIDGIGLLLKNTVDGVRFNAGAGNVVLQAQGGLIPATAGQPSLGAGNNGFAKLVLTEPGGIGNAWIRLVNSDPVDSGEDFGAIALDARDGVPGHSVWIFGPSSVYRPMLETIAGHGVPTMLAADGCTYTGLDGSVGSRFYLRIGGSWVVTAA